MKRLLGESDFVSVHLRVSDSTDGLLGRDQLALMKPTAFLINTSRGRLVNRDALIDALRGDQIAGAGLDVFHQEPIAVADDLLALPNVVLTPHNAGTTKEALEAGLRRAVDNVAEFLSAKRS